MTAAEIRALFRDFHFERGATDDNHSAQAFFLMEIAAQLAELNALLRDVADHILPWERR